MYPVAQSPSIKAAIWLLNMKIQDWIQGLKSVHTDDFTWYDKDRHWHTLVSDDYIPGASQCNLKIKLCFLTQYCRVECPSRVGARHISLFPTRNK